MLRKTIIALAASALLGATALAPTTAFAGDEHDQSFNEFFSHGHGHGGGHGHGH